MRKELIRFLKALVVTVVIIGLADLLIYQEFAIHFKLGVFVAVIYTVCLAYFPTRENRRLKKVF